MSPDTILKRLSDLHPKSIDLSLERLKTLLRKLENPEKKLPLTIHVAGTNGKGSTIAMLAAIYSAAGYSVHVYTSPHLVRFTERIVVGNVEIDPIYLNDILEECEVVNQGSEITLFEIITTAAFLVFSRNPADLLLLEVGLGGRLDATNVIERPALSVITPISKDHEDFLGDTLEKIAFEKAGILKVNTPAVIAPQSTISLDIIKNRAAELKVPLTIYGEDWKISDINSKFKFESKFKIRNITYPNLKGAHQLQNAGTAVASLEILSSKLPVTAQDIDRGLQNVHWPARLQKLDYGKLTEQLPHDTELWVDGGHNTGAAVAISNTLCEWKKLSPNRSFHIIFGSLNSRDPTAFLNHFTGLVGLVRTVKIPGEENSLSASEACKAALSCGLDAKAADDLVVALKDILINSSGKRMILVCGALYLSGVVLKGSV